ncbi:MAG: AAC(3) family N-acetyltransferase [candidate division Zixibacteria bacterium]|nr:AAC(3) family N-acetyltransferase [candidate division Zixibacteria bacterium]
MLSQIGIEKNDTIFLHSAYNNFNGFKGKPQDIIRCLLELIGDDGNLLMVSMPYTGSSFEYLKQNQIFDVRKTISRMGIISEVFRRKRGVRRSLHPTHPVLAYGNDTEWLLEDHEKCLHPCGKDTPFDKFRSLNGKILHFDVPFQGGFTLIHYIEDIIKDKLPFPLYTEEPIATRIRDYDNREKVVQTYVFSQDAIHARNLISIGGYLSKQNVLSYSKIGRTNLMIASAEDVILSAVKILGEDISILYDV